MGITRVITLVIGFLCLLLTLTPPSKDHIVAGMNGGSIAPSLL